MATNCQQSPWAPQSQIRSVPHCRPCGTLTQAGSVSPLDARGSLFTGLPVPAPPHERSPRDRQRCPLKTSARPRRTLQSFPYSFGIEATVLPTALEPHKVTASPSPWPRSPQRPLALLAPVTEPTSFCSFNTPRPAQCRGSPKAAPFALDALSGLNPVPAPPTSFSAPFQGQLLCHLK